MSGNLDADRLILLELNDRDLINTCNTNRYFRNQVCNELFFLKRLINKYPDTLINKPKNTTYKNWYLKIVFYVAKLKEQFDYDYIGGNPEVQYEIFKIDSDLDNILYESSIREELTLFKYALNLLPNDRMNMTMDMVSANGWLEGVKYLVDRSFDKSNIINLGLIRASMFGQLEVVKYLVEKGANKFEPTLRMAIQNGNLELVKYLVNQGANVDANVLEIAKNRNTDIFNYLREVYRLAKLT